MNSATDTIDTDTMEQAAMAALQAKIVKISQEIDQLAATDGGGVRMAELIGQRVRLGQCAARIWQQRQRRIRRNRNS